MDQQCLCTLPRTGPVAAKTASPIAAPSTVSCRCGVTRGTAIEGEVRGEVSAPMPAGEAPTRAPITPNAIVPPAAASRRMSRRTNCARGVGGAPATQKESPRRGPARPPALLRRRGRRTPFVPGAPRQANPRLAAFHRGQGGPAGCSRCRTGTCHPRAGTRDGTLEPLPLARVQVSTAESGGAASGRTGAGGCPRLPVAEPWGASGRDDAGARMQAAM